MKVITCCKLSIDLSTVDSEKEFIKRVSKFLNRDQVKTFLKIYRNENERTSRVHARKNKENEDSNQKHGKGLKQRPVKVPKGKSKKTSVLPKSATIQKVDWCKRRTVRIL